MILKLISLHLVLCFRPVWSDSASTASGSASTGSEQQTTVTVSDNETDIEEPTTTTEPLPILNLIFMLPFTSSGFQYTGGSIAPAIVVALEDVKSNLLPGYNLDNWDAIDTEHHSQKGVRKLTDLFNDYRLKNKVIHGIIGPENGELCFSVGFIAAAYNISQVSYGCEDTIFSEDTMYPTFARTTFNVDGALPVLAVKLIDHFKFTTFAIVYTTEVRQKMLMAHKIANAIKDAEGIKTKVNEFSIALIDSQSPGVSIKIRLFFTMLRMKRAAFAVYFLLVPVVSVKYIMQAADALSMLKGHHLFIVPLYGIASESSPHEHGLMVINYKIPETTQYKEFLNRLMQANKKAYKNEDLKPYKHFQVEKSREISYSAGLLYDAVQLWASGFNKSLGEKGLIKNGKHITDEIRNVNFEGMTGPVNLTSDNQRFMDFDIRVIQNGTFVTVGDYKTNATILTVDQGNLEKIIWPGGQDKMPGRIPVKEPKDETEFIIIVTGSSFGGLLILVILTVLIIRKMKFEVELKAVSQYFIKWADINVFIHPRKARQENINQHSAPGGLHGMGGGGGAKDEMRSFETYVINQWTDVGYYQDKKIVMKLMRNQQVDTKDRKILAEVVQIKKLHHDNLNPFIGVCVELPNVCICMAYCPKGSLWDVVSNHTIPMTWDFRMAIALDVARGMEYLHKSPIGSHGHLTSTNCMIDGRWTCKITDYGLSYFRRGYLLSKSATVDTNEDDQVYLWTAPELLRESFYQRPLNGTRSGDVYSYGIIIQEICYQQKPFGFCFFTLGAYGILSEVISGHTPPFRPMEPDDKAEMTGDTEKFSPKWKILMDICWAEDPRQRPTFTQILKQLLVIHERRPVRAIDNMVKMLESYTTRLENIVYERSQLVVDEKKKADSLLYNILPKFVAEQLKEGHKVLPEQFEAVTIYLSDIVGFTPLAAASTPIQVVNMLGMLYNSFDEIIDRNDVYKVETIGDAYVVASGLPIRNGNAHVVEIAMFALDILSFILGFQIPHMPRRPLEIRIGLHTGPVLAGVVGLKMPRYCLFGTTIGTANFMEHTAAVNSIHASDTTGALLLEQGSFILAEFTKMDYEDKKNVQTYRVRGRSTKRLSVSDPTPHPAVAPVASVVTPEPPKRRGSVPGHVRP